MILDSTYLLTDDQLANQFSVTFTAIPGSKLAPEDLTIRMDQTFQPPELTTNMYTYYIRGIQYTKPGMLDESPKELSITLRIDQNWKIWDALYAWKKLCYNSETGTRGNSKSAWTTMYVNMLDGNGTTKKRFKYGYTYLKGIAVESLDNASGDPLRVTLNMMYNTFEIDSGTTTTTTTTEPAAEAT